MKICKDSQSYGSSGSTGAGAVEEELEGKAGKVALLTAKPRHSSEQPNLKTALTRCKTTNSQPRSSDALLNTIVTFLLCMMPSVETLASA